MNPSRLRPLSTRVELLAVAMSLGLTACGSVQKRCEAHPWLLCGDRITLERPYVYLDDPAYLYNNRTAARREGEGDSAVYTFRLSLFFNPHRLQSPRMSAEIRTPDSAAGPSTCRVDTAPSAADTDPNARFAAADSAYPVSAASRKDRVTLRFLCPDYRPRWGRADTLALHFIGGPQPAADSNATATMTLPFTTSFHGSVYSFVAGSLMLVSLTLAGEIIAADK